MDKGDDPASFQANGLGFPVTRYADRDTYCQFKLITLPPLPLVGRGKCVCMWEGEGLHTHAAEET